MIDYYQILGINKNASDSEIKSAFRSLAMKHHPDKGGDVTKFQEIQEAYATLSDPQKRAAYDNPAPQFNAGPGGFQFDFNDAAGFEQLFRNAGAFGDIFGFARHRQPTNQNIQLQTSISLEDAFSGRELLASVGLPSGKEETVNIRIPPGIHEGTTLRLAGMGDNSIPNIARGDILLTVHINEHPIFKRQGDDLIREVEISCFQAMLGATITVNSIEGRSLETQIPAGIQHGSMLSLAGFGMPNFNDPRRRGRLILRIKIHTPTLSDEQKESLKQFMTKEVLC